jgi:hypothetical protein
MSTMNQPMTLIEKENLSHIIREISCLTDEGKIVWAQSSGEGLQFETRLPSDVLLRIRRSREFPVRVTLSATSGLTQYFQVETCELSPDAQGLLKTLCRKIESRQLSVEALFALSTSLHPYSSVASAILLAK